MTLANMLTLSGHLLPHLVDGDGSITKILFQNSVTVPFISALSIISPVLKKEGIGLCQENYLV